MHEGERGIDYGSATTHIKPNVHIHVKENHGPLVYELILMWMQLGFCTWSRIFYKGLVRSLGAVLTISSLIASRTAERKLLGIGGGERYFA